MSLAIRFSLWTCLPLLCLLLAAPPAMAQDLVVYSGRSSALVQPIIERFQEQTGIRVNARYGATAQMAVTLSEEGARSPADLFWAQDSGALATLAGRDMFQPLPQSVLDRVPEMFRSGRGLWVGTSGRARLLAYSSERVDEQQLPASVFDLSDARWRNRIGWAPANGSFQAFVTHMRRTYGEDRTQQWLRAVDANGAKRFANNAAILQGIAAGEIDLGITNHYYLLRSLEADANFPVRQRFFEEGDAGNLVFVAGLAKLKSSRRSEAADRFIEFMLSDEAQRYFVEQVYEYPVVEGVVEADERLVELQELLKRAPQAEADQLDDLEGTLRLLRRVGLQ